jgi:hypothetical protein
MESGILDLELVRCPIQLNTINNTVNMAKHSRNIERTYQYLTP